MRISDWSSDVCSSDLVTVYDAAVEELRKLEKENPKVKFTELFSDIEYTKGQYHSAINAMVEGAILAVVVVFLFLRDWRATLISALAIPLSAVPTFLFMDLMGFSLNMMTLLALSLVAGVLVRSEEHTSALQSLMRISYAV